MSSQEGSRKLREKEKINYCLTRLDDVYKYPKPVYIIDQLLVEKTVNLLGAYTGTGKSIAALSICKSILTGNKLWGVYDVRKTGPVLLVDEETPTAFLRDRVSKMGFDKNLAFFFLHFQDVRLDRTSAFEALMKRIREVRPVLVIIDSLIRVHRQKEDEATSMALVFGNLRRIANWGTTVLVIHHHKKGEGPLRQKLRGSSDIPGAVDIEYALVSKEDYLLFMSVKTRIKPFPPIKLKIIATEEKIDVVYQGGEIRRNILDEVLKMIEKEELGFEEIRGRIDQNGSGVGDRKLREMLRNGVKAKKLIERNGRRGKKFYRPAWQVGANVKGGQTANVV